MYVELEHFTYDSRGVFQDFSQTCHIQDYLSFKDGTKYMVHI